MCVSPSSAARPCTSSAGSASTARGSASRPTSTLPTSRRRSSGSRRPGPERPSERGRRRGMNEIEGRTVVPTDAPPSQPARLVDDFTPKLLEVGEHHLCPGCGEPIAMRSALEVIDELDVVQRTIAVFGIGCYTAFSNNLDVEVLQALHGRAPSLATGVKRAKPNAFVFTVQGDGDMVNEGLQEVIHTAARGENVTCIMLNNGVFGETGGHMTATTVIGQRTKNTLEGRNAEDHGHPILLANMLAGIDGSVYVAR